MEPTKAVTCPKGITPARASFKKHPKVHGFRALYFHYVYLLRGAANGRGSQKVSRYLLEDTIQFEISGTAQFLAEHRIETTEELQFTNNRLTAQLDTAVRERKPLYEERRHADEEQKEVLSLEISTRTAQIKQLRRELRLCQQIEADAERVQTHVYDVQNIKKEERYQ